MSRKAFTNRSKPLVATKPSRLVQTSSRYRHVKSVVDSGYTTKKYLDAIEAQRRYFRLSKDEIFYRIKLEYLARLVLELTPFTDAANSTLGDTANVLNAADTRHVDIEGGGDSRVNATPSRAATARSTLHSVISGIGELDLNVQLSDDSHVFKQRRPVTCTLQDAQLQQYSLSSEIPYLLLDVRDSDDFRIWHIKSAVNYPHTMLTRTMNYETVELLAYKNKPARMIIVYDEDEKLSQKVANTLVQRSYNNVYLLSGGINLAWHRYGEELMVGRPPAAKFPSQLKYL